METRGQGGGRTESRVTRASRVLLVAGSVVWPTVAWAHYGSSTVGIAGFYQAELLAVALLGLVPALLTAPWLVAALERRLGASRRGLATLLATLLPAVLAGLGLWGVSWLPPVVTDGYAGITMRPAEIRELIPWLTLGGGAFGLGLGRRRLLGRLGVLATAVVVAVAAVNAWVQVVSYREGAAKGLELCTWDLAGLAWRGPLAVCLALTGIVMGVARRSGRAAGLPRGVALGAYALALGVALWSEGYPAVWSADQIESIRFAGLTPEGSLVLVVSPVREVRLIGHSEAVLVRRAEGSKLRAVSGRPSLALGFGSGRELDPDLHRVSRMEPAALAERLAGCLARRVLVDTDGGGTKVLSRVWQFAEGKWWLPSQLGPGRSVIVNDESTGCARGRTVDGRRFETSLNGLRWADNGASVLRGSWLTFLAEECPGDEAIRGRRVTCVGTFDLCTGTLTWRHAPFHMYWLFGGGTTPLSQGFLVRAEPVGEMHRTPAKTYEIDADGQVSLLSPCPEQLCLSYWQEDGHARLVARRPVTEAITRATDDVTSSGGEEIAALCEVGGHPLAHRFRGDLVQLDPALTVAEPVSHKPLSVQWLDDSVVLCEEADGGPRVVRYWPESRRREVLLSLPRRTPDGGQ